MSESCPKCGSPQHRPQEWTCGTYQHGDRVQISLACDYLAQLHDAKKENAALTAEVERLKEGIQEIKDDCVCENIHSRPHELTAIKCGVLSKAFALLAKPEEKQ